MMADMSAPATNQKPDMKHFRVMGFIHILVTARNSDEVKGILRDAQFSVQSPTDDLYVAVGSWHVDLIERPD